MEDRESILRQVQALAGSRANDAVKLAFLTGEELERLDGLDLSAVTELKRNKDGGVEVKFIDRLSALQWLLEQGAEPKGSELRRDIAAEGAKVWQQGE